MRYTMLFAAASLLTARLFAADYVITKLNDVIPSAINSSGQIAATLNVVGAPRAMLWTRAGGAQDLGTLGGSWATTRDINENGQIVGMSVLQGDTATHAFLWSPSQGMQDLGAPAGTLSYAVKINENGQVAGQWLDPTTNVLHPFVWSSSGGMVDLGSPLGGVTLVADFNAAGHVVFVSVSANGQFQRSYFWTLESGATELDGIVASGLDDQDQIIGSAGGHAMLWTSGVVKDLGTLGGPSSFASFINSTQVIAGYSLVDGGTQTHSFRWTQDAGMQDLGQIGRHANNSPTALNNKGVIVGVDSGTYVWSEGTGMRTISVMGVPLGLNDSGQIIGTTKKSPPEGLLATPVVKVTFTSSQNPSHAGQSVTFTAIVTSVAGTPPDGEIIKFADGAKNLGSAPLVGGVTSLTISTLSVGIHSIKANYTGDNNYFASKSAVLKQVVNP
jgi:probable HAF family extracellular repeat protein